jgi:hypothetical protein
MDRNSQEPPPLPYSKRTIDDALHVVPSHIFLLYITLFTFGVALVGTTISILWPFGVVLAFVGLSRFMRDRRVLSFVGAGIFLLGTSLALLLQGLRLGKISSVTIPKPPMWYCVVIIISWGCGILFCYRRWHEWRTKQLPPNQSSEPTLASGTSPAGQEPRLP